ncbi:MAG TPA: hypothetical protein VF735_13365 [Pyrinomonadaceae bacterium]|jgi:hypothetical protein
MRFKATILILATIMLCLISQTASAQTASQAAVAGISSRIREQTYVRYRPRGGAIDRFMKDDRVRLHYKSPSGGWICVSGTTRFGQSYSGWVISSSIPVSDRRRVPVSNGSQSPCQTKPTHTQIKYPCVGVIGTKVPFLFGPSAGAPGFKNFYFNPKDRVGVATDDRGRRRPVVNGFVWVSSISSAAQCNHEVHRVAPGKTGWVQLKALDPKDPDYPK